MGKYILIGVLIAGVALATYIGCDGVKDRVGVAADKAVEKIDKLLGDINVKEKALTRAMGEAKAQTASMKDKLYEAKSRVKLYGEKKETLSKSKAELLNQVKQIAPLLKSSDGATEVELNGNKVSVAALDALAKKAVNQIAEIKGQLQKNEQLYTAWAKNLDVLTKNVKVSEEQLEKFENQMSQIRAKKEALDGMKQAASITGPEISISDKFDKMTGDIEELLVKVDAEFDAEMDKVDERVAEMDSNNVSESLDKLLNGGKADVSNTVSDLEKLIAEEGGN